MDNLNLLILLTIAFMALIDYVPRAFIWAKKTVTPMPLYSPIPDYRIMPTVYGDISYLKNISFLKKYSDKVIICTSIFESKEFYRELRSVCRKYGFQYAKVDLPIVNGKPVKNAYTIYRGFFEYMDVFKVSADTPCLLIDADTCAESNVNNLIRTFINEKLDIASLRCEVAKPKTAIEELQALEYRLAMDNRRMDPWMTSGACNLATAKVFRHVFSNHSNFFAGGDVEIGKLAHVMHYKIKHINFTFYTAAPDDFKSWFNQRLIWFAGGFRHHVTNMGSFGWYHFFLLFYNSLLIYMLLPLRWLEVVNYPLTLLVLIVLSWIYTAILVTGRNWKPVYLLLPFYAFIQSMIILPWAIVRYFKLVFQHRSLGRLRYDLSNISLGNKVLYKVLNYSSVMIVLYAAISFTIVRWDYWSAHGPVMKAIFNLF
jgi:hypothetical protein